MNLGLGDNTAVVTASNSGFVKASVAVLACEGREYRPPVVTRTMSELRRAATDELWAIRATSGAPRDDRDARGDSCYGKTNL